MSSADNEPVVFNLDPSLDRNHLADGLDLIKPFLFLRAGSELRGGDKVLVLGSYDFTVVEAVVDFFVAGYRATVGDQDDLAIVGLDSGSNIQSP